MHSRLEALTWPLPISVDSAERSETLAIRTVYRSCSLQSWVRHSDGLKPEMMLKMELIPATLRWCRVNVLAPDVVGLFLRSLSRNWRWIHPPPLHEPLPTLLLL